MTLRTLVIPLSVAVLCSALLWQVVLTSASEEGVRQFVRFTAGSSLLLFALAWSASSLNRLVAGRWRPVMKARRRTGIAFAISHSFHLLGIALLVEVAYDGDWSEMELAGGGVVYGFIYLMAFTSNDWSVKKLGPGAWKWLHKVGGYVIWFAFTLSYLGNALELGAPRHWLFGLACLALLALRMVAWRAQRSVQSDAVLPGSAGVDG